MRSFQVAGIVGKFKNVIRESPGGLDEHAIGGWNQRDRLSPGNIPDARQISALQDRQLRDGNILEVRRCEASIGAVEPCAHFVDPFRRNDSGQTQLKELISAVFGGAVDSELART